MAAPFVPVPFPVDWTGACRSWTRRGSPLRPASSMDSEPSPPQNISWVIGAGPCSVVVGTPIPDDSWSRPKEGVLDGLSTLLEDEGRRCDSWVERPITPTLLGYDILEGRAKFTVYKILVREGQGDSWVIFRRYKDFHRLHDKLKKLFPSFCHALPPKRWFKDNYDAEFLDKRQIGLQTFLQKLTLDKDVIGSEAVRNFLCLVDPPSPFDSPEEIRAFCETLEETNHHLQTKLSESQREFDILKRTLEEKEYYISLLVKKAKPLTLSAASGQWMDGWM
ncbi:sorting nexin-16-like isoform X1 [Acanthopagrus latus]|uniref:sorting nexin-16-like isoform X1 n=1 Tax=Acanthopagrus latus TaxID=8177 RepID=UPI00187C9AC2|nr:sorting nexin-16-like isoform X1 [Acanthopagrus latus]